MTGAILVAALKAISEMGASDKAFKILTVAAIASVAAYLGYRAYKKRYPFEDSTTKVAPVDSISTENGAKISGIFLQSNCIINI